MQRKHLRSLPTPPRTTRVLVVDDHALYAEALMLTLAIEDRIEVVGCASNGIEAVTLAEILQPDVVLMDLHMPRMDGIEATKGVRGVAPDAWVVIVTGSKSPEAAAHALAAGAGGYLTKDVSALQLIDAVLNRPAAEMARAG
jgi:DNA-binding NarL/FixJ family response regulator